MPGAFWRSMLVQLGMRIVVRFHGLDWAVLFSLLLPIRPFNDRHLNLLQQATTKVSYVTVSLSLSLAFHLPDLHFHLLISQRFLNRDGRNRPHAR